jgi:uncharacterized membrane protein YedE/YeeE
MELSSPHLVLVAGFVIGLAFGAIVDRTGFCTMGAIADWVGFGERTRMNAWILAMAVALIGAQALHFAGLVDLGMSIYAGPRLAWLGAALGGFAFGIGMTLAGGCASRTLVRLGAGNLKSLVVLLVIAVTSYAALRGILARPRLALIDAMPITFATSQALPALLGDTAATRGTLAIVIALTLAALALRNDGLRANRRLLAGAIAIGMLVVAGWMATGLGGRDPFDPTPPASLTFVGPVGDTVLYLMVASGASLNFGIATTAGALAGAFASARLSRSFRWEGFSDRDDLVRHILGGALMGTGGALAMGCSIGNGVTGLSTLSLGSCIALAAMIAGGAVATRVLEEGGLAAAWRAWRAATSR